MHLPESAITNMAEECTLKFKDRYTSVIYPKSGVEYEEFWGAVLGEILAEVEVLSEMTNDTIMQVSRRRQKAKRRWYKVEVIDEKETAFTNEIEVIAKGLYQQVLDGDIKLETFHDIYKCNSYKDLRDLRIEDLKQWVEDDETPIFYFKYIKSKTTSQVEKALINDIKYICYKLIKEQCPLGQQSVILGIPNSISRIPIDYTSRVKMNKAPTVKSNYEEFFVDKYHIDDETIFESALNTEILKTGVLQKFLKALNGTDIDIFLAVMSLRDESFYTTREIIVDIGKLVRNVFGKHSRGSNNYMTVKSSLYKMQYLSSGAVSASLRGFTIKIFDNVEVYKTKDTQEVARIRVNIDIVSQYIKNQTINMYRDTIDKFKLKASKVMIFPLQRERVRIANEVKEGEPLILQANLNFFRGILYFSNRKKRENIITIKESLEEIKKYGFALKDFKHRGDYFILEFFPMTEREKRDLLNNTTPEDILLEPSPGLIDHIESDEILNS